MTGAAVEDAGPPRRLPRWLPRQRPRHAAPPLLPWGRMAVVVTGSALLIAAPSLVRSVGGGGGAPGPGPSPPSRVEPEVPVTPPPPAQAPQAPPGGGEEPVVEEPGEEEVWVAAARTAVEAWGRFAATRSLGEVDGAFAPDGPQFVQFRTEAAAGPPAGPAPQFTLEQAAVAGDTAGGDPVVRTEVTVTVEGSQPQSHRWDLRLRQDPGGGAWRVWEVRETP